MKPIFRVSFYKCLTNCNGAVFNPCQGSVEVHAYSLAEALAVAKPMFAMMANVPDWTMRADAATAELVPGRKRIGHIAAVHRA